MLRKYKTLVGIGSLAISFSMTILLAGCASSTAPSSVPRTAGQNSARVHSKSLVAPPASGVYLGAQVNPSDGPTATPQQLINETAILEASMTRPLALHMHYFDWKTMANIDQEPTIQDDVAHNRIPVIAWHCADDMRSPALNLSQIYTAPTTAQAQQDLATIGQHLALVKSADGSSYPIILRYFWEFNVNAAGEDPFNANGNDGCFTGNSSSYPGEFIGAWQKIYSSLGGLLPRPNVSFDWNPNVTDSINSAAPYSAYYPGPSYVDWIGFDGYNKQDNNNNPLGFSGIFYNDLYSVSNTNVSFYASKPIIIAETGSCDEYNSPNSQAQYLQSVQSTLESNTSPWTAVKAFMYFDAPGGYLIQPTMQHCHYSLNTGLSEWDTLAADPFFGATVLIP